LVIFFSLPRPYGLGSIMPRRGRWVEKRFHNRCAETNSSAGLACQAVLFPASLEADFY
jgi:hypothetical protein